MVGKVSPARLLIADDHALVREGLRTMLSKEPDLEVVGEAENGREAVEMCSDLRPDLVLMDVRMPEVDGLAATRVIKRDHPTIGVLMVTTHENPDYLLEAIKAGAAGYVLKDASKRQLINAVHRVLGGENPLNQELATQLLRRLVGNQERPKAAPITEERPAELSEPLTRREHDILALVARGHTNRKIAEVLTLSVGTVKNHVRHIIRKLGVSDRTQAAIRALQADLLTPENINGRERNG